MTIWQGHTDTRRCRLESEVQLPSYSLSHSAAGEGDDAPAVRVGGG